MSSKTISQLLAGTALIGTELLEISQLSTTVKINAATTLSAQASDNSYNDSANGFLTAGFAVGDKVKVAGFTGNVANNITSGVITALTAGKMTIGGTDGDVIVDDAAGEAVTITKWVTRRCTTAEVAALYSGGGGGGGGATPVVVQFAAAVNSTAGSFPGTVTLGAAPTAGNMLVAITGDWQGTTRTDVAGWNRMAINQSTQSQDTGSIYWKVCGAGESATQTIFSTSTTWDIAMWEVSGTSPAHILNAVVLFSRAAATALSMNAGVPKDNCLCLGAFQFQGGATTVTIGAGPTTSGSSPTDVGTLNQGPRGIVGIQQNRNKGAWQPTATLNVARINGYGFVVLGGA